MTNANDLFNDYTGTENYYKHWLEIVYTDGVKALAKKCSSYWLIDLIGSHQKNENVRNEPFQVWELKRINECQFNITATDGNNKIIAKQTIPFSDFPFDSCTIWLSDGIVLLPTEY